MMHSAVPPELASPGLIVDHHESGTAGIIVHAHGASATSAGPVCGLASSSVHSRSRRTLGDVPAHADGSGSGRRHGVFGAGTPRASAGSSRSASPPTSSRLTPVERHHEPIRRIASPRTSTDRLVASSSAPGSPVSDSNWLRAPQPTRSATPAQKTRPRSTRTHRRRSRGCAGRCPGCRMRSAPARSPLQHPDRSCFSREPSPRKIALQDRVLARSTRSEGRGRYAPATSVSIRSGRSRRRWPVAW